LQLLPALSGVLKFSLLLAIVGKERFAALIKAVGLAGISKRSSRYTSTELLAVLFNERVPYL
jgi:hypothetical protein